MNPIASTSVAPSTTTEKSTKQKDIQAAAGQFEALLISQLLRSARQSNSEGAMGGSQDSASDTALGMAEESLARTMATQGGLGLARIIVNGLGKQADAQSTQLREAAPAAASSK